MNHEYEGYNIRVVEAAGLAAIIFPPGEKAIMAVVGKYRQGVEERADLDTELAGVKRAHPVFKTIGSKVEVTGG